MKTLIITCLVVCLVAGTVLAASPLDRTPPAKTPSSPVPPPPAPDVLRQGGDTFADAIALPAPPGVVTGTTVGYTHDYDEECPFSGSTSPDVVYTHTPASDEEWTFDLFGSSYDTKIYIYDADLNLVACNDDYWPDYTSYLVGVPFAAGVTYYVVIDGYGGDAGEYVLTVEAFVPCDLAIPAGAIPEGEPPLEVDYQDCYNNGCQTMFCDGQWVNRFQELEGDPQGNLAFHGRTGWYPLGGASTRDSEYLIITMGPTGTVEVTFDAEAPVFFYRLDPPDCASTSPVQTITGGACAPAAMTITDDPGAEVWVWVGPNTFEAPDYLDPDGDGVAEIDYVIEFSGLAQGTVAVESHSWTSVKGIFD